MIIWKGSPNFNAGRSGYKPEAIVIHVMSGTLTGTDSWFAAPLSQVSAHYGIGTTGEVHQYVKEADTAFHAGRVKNPQWDLLKPNINPNLYTIGIEHEGIETSQWPNAQKQVSAQLIADVCGRYGIPIDREHIIGHYQIFADKPNCPAVDKSIIDTLISLAKTLAAPTPNTDLADGIALVEQGLAKIKKATNQ